MQEVSLQEIKDALLHHFKPVNFEAPESAKFNMLSHSPSESIRSYALQLQRQAAESDKAVEQPAVLLHKCQNGRKQYKQLHKVSLHSSSPSKPKAQKFLAVAVTFELITNSEILNAIIATS